MIDTKELRCNVVHLALSGKLTHQNPCEDAKALLNRINAKKSIEQKDDVPYIIPSNWAWCKMKDLFIINPKVDADDEADAAFIPMERVNAGFSRNFTFEKQTWKIASKNHTKFVDGDVAFAKISPCFENRKSFIAENLPNGIGGGTTELIVLRQPELMAEYTYLVIVDQRFIKAGSASYKGIVGQQRIKTDSYKEYLVPVAPIEEQKRIVDTVKNAFRILDQIDQLQQQYSSDLEILKSKIIDAGIQGKLTEQLPEDGTAEELLKQITEEKKQLVKEKKIKATKALPEITVDEIPFEIPDNWCWTRWGDISQSIQYGYNAPAKSFGRIKMVRISDIQDGKVLWDSVPYCEIDESEIEVYLLHENDILFARTGATVGKSYIVSEIPEMSVFAGYLIRTSYSSNLCAMYMKYFMESKLYWRQLQNGTIATAQPNCNGQTLSKMILPIPPYAEQVRIVEKINATITAIGD